MNLDSKTVVGLFVKYPEAGKVKTRLAKTVGFEEAARIYDELAKTNFEVLKKIQNVNVQIAIYYDPPERKIEIEDWLAKASLYIPQKGKSLDQRLIEAFRELFNRGYHKAIILGSDTLALSENILSEAIKKLDEKEFVIGPAMDGGYYLIGMSCFMPEVFEGIPWSTGEVLAKTIEKMNKYGYEYQLIETLEDLDEIKTGGS
jgi:rSAM/selenodomain-associated transferase 1